jgi:leader peptidase (prepilin peptidase) / N-methyltransferase
MPRRRRRRPNWPYRLAWLTIVGSLLLYIGLGTLIGALTSGRRNYGIDWQIAFVSSCFSATLAIWFTMIGASVGSFLNVVAYRLPLGRTIGGHSGCPYCATPIAKFDNVPVLAWLRLRGRCRTCRLPISPQYPLVEFLVAMVFLFAFLTEVRLGGSNLPSYGFQRGYSSLVVSSTMVLRMISYLSILSGLLAAALIVVKGKFPPLILLLICLLPLLTLVIVDPAVTVVSYHVPSQVINEKFSATEALVTTSLGFLAGIVVAQILTPLMVAGMHKDNYADEVEIAIQEYRLVRAIQTWTASLAIAGAVVGWQAMVPLGWVIAACWLMGTYILSNTVPFSYKTKLHVYSASAWVWLGLMLFRGGWYWFDRIQILPSTWPLALRHVAGLMLLAVFSHWISKCQARFWTQFDNATKPAAAPYTENSM